MWKGNEQGGKCVFFLSIHEENDDNEDDKENATVSWSVVEEKISQMENDEDEKTE